MEVAYFLGGIVLVFGLYQFIFGGAKTHQRDVPEDRTGGPE